jgi:hypothetical protein
VDVVLRREPTNEHDRNAIRVEVLGQHVGYLQRIVAADYSVVIEGAAMTPDPCLIAPGVITWETNEWEDGEGKTESHLSAEVLVHVPAAEYLFPLDRPPANAIVLPALRIIQVLGEEEHLSTLVSLLAGKDTVATVAELVHQITQGAKSAKETVDVEVRGSRIGWLSPASAKHVLPLVRLAGSLGRPLTCFVTLSGNSLNVEAELWVCRATELSEGWIDRVRSGHDQVYAYGLFEQVTDTATVASGLPPANWYPNYDGPGLRWWDGSRWTDHLHVG